MVKAHADDLADAVLALLDGGGWIQGDWWSSQGRCIVGAIESVLGVDLRTEADCLVLPFFLDDDWIDALRKLLFQLLVETDSQAPFFLDPTEILHEIASFNDASSTSFEDVRLVLKRARAELHRVPG
jgi:hypothetical protein